MPSPPSELPDVPLIPAEVYESRDRGDLVLFCGAGISNYEGCTAFRDLVRDIKAEFDQVDLAEGSALEKCEFDRYLQFVEQRVDKPKRENTSVEASTKLRQFVQRRLGNSRTSVPVHEAILRLARDEDGRTRLVTTNYDPHFRTAESSLRLSGIRHDAAPRLAPPDRRLWNSIVYLHGEFGGSDLRDLVLTSGDFGRAYITERWAARFITELFKNFDVLFVGYSASDPVVRYVLDAFAARRHSRDRRIWAIAAPGRDSAAHLRAHWESVNVQLIPYNDASSHEGVSSVLTDWAAVIADRSSRFGRVREILSRGPDAKGASEPNIPSRDERQLQWLLGCGSIDVGAALVDVETPSGINVPACSANWLPVFARLGLLGIEPVRFAGDSSGRVEPSPQLVGLDAASTLRSVVVPQPLGATARGFTHWMAALACDGPKQPGEQSNSEGLLNWIQQSRREAALHPELADVIRQHIDTNGSRLPDELREAWRLVLDPSINARLSPPVLGQSRWALERSLESGQANDLTNQRLLHALAPVAVFHNESTAERARVIFRVFRERLRAKKREEAVQNWQPRRHDFAQPEIVPHCGTAQAEHLLTKLSRSQGRDALLRGIAIGANALLERALELLSRTQPAFDYGECLQYPRVGALADPSRRSAWTLFADLAWHAGTELDRAQDRRARALYEAWLGGTHATQRRLALCAAASWTHLTHQDRITALEGGSPAWLERGALASELLELLRRLKRDGIELGERFIARLQELEQKSAIKESPPEPDEDIGFIAPPAPVDVTNATIDRLADLMLNKTDFTSREGRTGGELEVLVKRGESRRLLEAVELALTKYQPKATLELAGGRVLADFPDRAARYLLAIAEHEEKSESASPIKHDELVALWDKVEPVAMGADRGGMADSSREELTKALNHPAGKLAQALFAILMPRSVQYRSSHDERLKERLERNVTKPGAAGRAFLAIASSRLFVLHYAEPQWTATALVPHFDWKSDEDRARTCWQGYLWAPQLNADLYAELRGAFLDTFKRADQLGEFAESLSGLLVSLALDGGDVLRPEDTRRALRDMPESLRSTVVWQLGKRAKEAEAGAAELARTRILPWLRTWPLDARVWHDDKLADQLAQLALKCGDAIGDMIGVLAQHSELKLGRWPMSLHAALRAEHEGLIAQHPHDIARLFDHVLPSREENLRLGGQVWYPAQLQQLVDKLRAAGEPVTSSPEFKRLEARL